MQITVKPGAYILWAVILLVIPLQWVSAWMIAAFVHELSHWCAVRLCGGRIYRLTIGAVGADMQCSALTDIQQFVSVLSGPVGGILPVIFASRYPRLAICCWALSVYNLLPLMPLDGGRALRIIIKNPKVFSSIQNAIFMLIILTSAFAACFWEIGVLPLVIVGMLWFKRRNNPCK